MSITEDVAAWVADISTSSIPANVDAASRLCLLDGIGTALAASAASLGEPVARLAAHADGTGACSVIGTHVRAEARVAALANGWLINALDWDDTYLPAVIHSTCNVLPAALGVCDERDRSLADLVTAFVAGTEVTLALSVALRNQTFLHDYSTSGTLGPFGATCAAAKAWGHVPDRIADALGIAGTLAGGVLQSVAEGCSVKALGPGMSALQGVLATQLAASGVSGPREILEGRLGLAVTYFRGVETDLAQLPARLGAPWLLPDIELKRHPGAHRAHAYVETALQLVREGNLDPDEVERITCVCSPQIDYFNFNELGRRPPNRYMARFSLPYMLAVALFHDRLTESHFDDRHRTNERVLALAERIRYRIDRTREEAELLGEVEVALADGRRIIGTPASPQSNPSDSHLDFARTKFLANAAQVVGESAAERVAEAICHGHELPVKSLLAWLRPNS